MEYLAGGVFFKESFGGSIPSPAVNENTQPRNTIE